MSDAVGRRLDRLRALRDELRLKAHLAPLAIRQRWPALELRVDEVLRRRGVPRSQVDALARELFDFFESIRRSRASAEAESPGSQ